MAPPVVTLDISQAIATANNGAACSLSELLDQPQALQTRLKEYFHAVAQPVQLDASPVLRFEDMQVLTERLSDDLDVDLDLFAELSQMFWRFDFVGEGLLDEQASVKLCLSMLRKYRDATRTPAVGAVRLGDGIAYRNVYDRYTIDEKLGQGGQGVVFLGKDKRNGQEVVVKMCDKSSSSSPVEELTREFGLLMTVRHPRIAHVFEIFQDFANIYVVQEPYFGGDLTTAIPTAADAGVRVDEPWLAFVMHQILSGVAFLHSNHVMHCDLKEPNVMITGKTDWHRPQIVVIDFGLANEFSATSHPGGTPGYMPPEVWDHGLWTPKGDVFSLGVMLYSMRSGQPPFSNCQTLEEVQYNTRELLPQMPQGSPELQTLVHVMLDKSFHRRPSVSILKDDPWFSGSASSDNSLLSAFVLSALVKRQKDTELKKAFMTDLASKQNLAQMKELNDLFIELDSDNDGVVGADEVRRVLEDRWPHAQTEALIKVLLGDEGFVNYEEFIGQLLFAMEPEENELLLRVFGEADRRQKGYLDLDDIQALLQRPAIAKVLGDRDPATLLRIMDSKKTGKVTFEDFKRVMNGGPPQVKGGRLASAWRFGPRFRAWTVGEELEYYSQTHGRWVACQVTAIDAATGFLQVDVKPGYWLGRVEMVTRLRRGRSLLNRIAVTLNPFHWLPSQRWASCIGPRTCTCA